MEPHQTGDTVPTATLALLARFFPDARTGPITPLALKLFRSSNALAAVGGWLIGWSYNRFARSSVS